MARVSKHGHVQKACKCTKWKTCSHPWYLNYQVGPRATRLRKLLSKLTGREPSDFADAKAEAARAIRAHLDGRDARQLLPDDAPTLSQLIEAYATRPNPTSPFDKYQRKNIPLVVIRGRPFGEHLAMSVTSEMLDRDFRLQRPRVAGNRELARLRAMYNWAVVHDLVPATPFKKGGVSVVRLAPEPPRDRRLHEGEYDALIAWASRPFLRDLIIALVETGCRVSELLTLRWARVQLVEGGGGGLMLPGGLTKNEKPRRLPISSVLQQVLESRRLDPAGQPHLPTAFVFGDEAGRERGSYAKEWEDAILRAHGYTVTRHRRGKLDAECRKRLNEIDLNVHDLRREAGSRWMDAGVAPSMIQKWLGHANLSTTSKYLATLPEGDQSAMQAFEKAAGRLVQIGSFSSPIAPNRVPKDQQVAENANKNATKH